MSESFERFMASVRSTEREWIDDYDLHALRELEPEERSEAERVLIGRLDENDPRAPRALSEMSSQAAIHSLRCRLADSAGAMRVEIALALGRIAGFDGTAQAILPVLGEEDHYDRVYAAHALSELPTSEIADALLLAAGGDPDRDVRTTAATSLLLMSGILTSLFDDSHKDLLVRLDSSDSGVVEGAAEELRLLVGLESAEGFCMQCGTKLRPGTVFCTACGGRAGSGGSCGPEHASPA